MTDPAGITVAYGDGPFATSPTRTRIDDRTEIAVVTGWNVRRGRAYMLDQTDTGTLSVPFVDTKGNLDPTNSSGPFYPMNPNSPVTASLWNPVAVEWVSIFQGLAQQIPQSLDLSSHVSTGTLAAQDMFSLLAIAELPPGIDYDDTGSPTSNTDGNTRLAAQNVDDRIRTLLVLAGVPTGLDNIIYTGNIVCQPVVYPPGTTIMQAIQDAADAEFPGVAIVYIDKDGLFTFHGRDARFTPSGYSAHTWHVGDMPFVNANPDTVPVQQIITFDRDISKLINAALYTPQGIADADIAAQLVQDSGSITNYGIRSISGTGLYTGQLQGAGFTQSLANAQALLYGTYYVDNFKDPQNRVSQAVFRWLPPSDPNAEALWNLLCNIEIGDVMEITTTHPGGGGFSALGHFVEGLTYDVGIGPRYTGAAEAIADVTLTVDLSPQAFFTPEPTGWT